MNIVPYTQTDAQSVASFFREIFAELGWTERTSDYMDEPHKLFHLPENGLLLLVKEDDKVIGTAGIILLSKTEGLIKRAYLKKEYRGSGIAKKLLDELISNAAAMKIKRLVLDVSKSNTRAIKFYKKSGFLPTTVNPREDWQESNEPESHLYFYKELF